MEGVRVGVQVRVQVRVYVEVEHLVHQVAEHEGATHVCVGQEGRHLGEVR